MLTASPLLDDEQRRGLNQRFDADIPTTAAGPIFCGCHNMRSPFIGITVVFIVIFSLIIHLHLLFVPRMLFCPPIDGPGVSFLRFLPLDWRFPVPGRLRERISIR